VGLLVNKHDDDDDDDDLNPPVLPVVLSFYHETGSVDLSCTCIWSVVKSPTSQAHCSVIGI